MGAVSGHAMNQQTTLFSQANAWLPTKKERVTNLKVVVTNTKIGIPLVEMLEKENLLHFVSSFKKEIESYSLKSYQEDWEGYIVTMSSGEIYRVAPDPDYAGYFYVEIRGRFNLWECIPAENIPEELHWLGSALALRQLKFVNERGASGE